MARGATAGERKDVVRNRERLLEVALRLIGERGPDVSPRAIAQEAGVGIGTLYRHFPDREALIQAVYLADLENLCGSVPDLLEAHRAYDALRIWLGRCVDHAWTKQGLSRVLRSALGTDGSVDSRELLIDAVPRLLEAGIAEGSLRTDLEPFDILLAVTGVSLATDQYSDRAGADRLLDLMMDSYTTEPRQRS